MGKTAMKLLGMGDEEFYEGMGVFFVTLAQDLGYGMLLSCLGRYFRDFFVNLDNLHDYLKFTFPRMKAPSFFIAEESNEGVTMEYRSKRRGFQFYVQGQIKELSKNFANEIKKLEIELKKQEVVFDTVVTYFELKFENKGYERMKAMQADMKADAMPIKASVLFEMFPFSILYNANMEVTCLGVALRQIIPKIVGEGLSSWWELVKPLVEFRWEVIMSRLNSMFELATQEEIDKLGKSSGRTSSSSGFDDVDNLLDEEIDKTLHIKGQMVYMKDWEQMLFLACPMMPDLNNLVWSGLFINDLSMHDYSRDIMLATTQEKIQMKMTLQTMEKKSAKLDEQQKKLAEVMKKSDDIIAQMLPKQVADELAKGKSNADICKSYECVTMLFSDVVTFTIICSKLKPTQVVQLLNNMYTLFDFLCDQNAVYKVETIGDAYLIVAGCPNKAANHALKICDMAFDMMDGIKILKVPGSGDDIHMRIGIHSGPVVAGVVGLKMPRYCLFGLNVGLTEKFESNSQPMKIHISEPCKQLLSAQYKCEQRDAPEVREKCGGRMSYFLTSKDGRQPLRPEVIKALLPTASEMPSVGNKKEDKKADDPKKEEKKGDAPKKEEHKEDAPKTEDKKDDAPKAEAKKADATKNAPAPAASPAANDSKPAEAAAAPSAQAGDAPVSEETAAPVESAPQEDSPPAATDENEADESKDAGSVKGMDDGMPVEVVNQQCCTGSKACLIL